jgi:hypothetical protein
MTVESKYKIPTAGIITERFEDFVKQNAYKRGYPNYRFTFVPHPVAGMPASVHRQYIEGKDPITGKPVMEEIIQALTKPLTEEEKKTGFLETVLPRLVEPDTKENLQRLFFKNGWTDGLPIVLPTEERVAAMLKGSSHKPDEVVGKMAFGIYEAWSYTVEKVAVNAVMAGAKPEYFPVILAIASTGIGAYISSTGSHAGMVVVNGPIRNQIGMNYGMGALGPYNEANATIGRSWTLMTKNLAGGVLGSSYIGTLGNNLNYNNCCFAENEERSPWVPFHVEKGFKPEESVVSVFRAALPAFVGSYGVPRIRTPQEDTLIMMRSLGALQPSISGGGVGQPNISGAGPTLVMDPLVAKNFKEIQGFETKQKLSQWLIENYKITAKQYWETDVINTFVLPVAKKGVEPYASWLQLPKDALMQPYAIPGCVINTVVVGGETNAFWQVFDMKYVASMSIDKWR